MSGGANNNMEDMRQLFARWSIDDLNAVLRLSGGDCRLAMTRIVQHDRSGLPAGDLVRLLGEGAPLEDGRLPGRGAGTTMPPASVGEGRHHLGRPDAAHDRAYASVAGSPRAHPANSPRAHHHTINRSQTDIPPVVHVESSVGGGCADRLPGDPYEHPSHWRTMSRREYHDPQTQEYHHGPRAQEYYRPQTQGYHHQPHSRGSSRSTPMSAEATLKQMSSLEKDQLLRQLLSRPGSVPEDSVPSNYKELDMRNHQTGLLQSYQKQEKAPGEHLDEEALRFGIEESRQEYLAQCRRQDQEKELERVLLTRVAADSLATALLGQQREARLLEEAKRESLLSHSQASRSQEEEERLLEDAKRESLMHPPLSREDHLVEDVKRASLLDCPLQALEGFEYLTVERPPTFFAATHVSAEESESVSMLQSRMDGVSLCVSMSSMSDRKPAAK